MSPVEKVPESDAEKLAKYVHKLDSAFRNIHSILERGEDSFFKSRKIKKKTYDKPLSTIAITIEWLEEAILHDGAMYDINTFGDTFSFTEIPNWIIYQFKVGTIVWLIEDAAGKAKLLPITDISPLKLIEGVMAGEITSWGPAKVLELRGDKALIGF